MTRLCKLSTSHLNLRSSPYFLGIDRQADIALAVSQPDLEAASATTFQSASPQAQPSNIAICLPSFFFTFHSISSSALSLGIVVHCKSGVGIAERFPTSPFPQLNNPFSRNLHHARSLRFSHLFRYLQYLVLVEHFSSVSSHIVVILSVLLPAPTNEFPYRSTKIFSLLKSHNKRPRSHASIKSTVNEYKYSRVS